MNSYNRGGFLGSMPQVTKVILIINIAVFIVDYLSGLWITQRFALYSIHTNYFKPVQLVTHMFLHGGFMHIFFNMFGLVMFGKVLETVLGSKKFFILYFLSGLGAAGLQLLIYYLQGIAVPMVGASGAIFGILAGFAMLFPNVELMIIPIPIPIKAKYLVLGYVALDLFSGLVSFSGDNIAHFAHLGGAIVGFFLIRYWKKNQFRMF